MPRKYAAFLSFARPDLRLVEALRQVFEVLGVPVYFSRELLPQTGTEDWVESIREAIRESSSFVPVITRSSLSRSWVIYETGAADAIGTKRLPVRVAGVRIKEMDVIPGGQKIVHSLDREQGVIDLATQVLREHFGEARADRDRIAEKLLGQREVLDKLLGLARERWVFIAGSSPEGAFRKEYPPKMKVRDGTLDDDEVLATVTRSLTSALLDAGFSVMSCSTVDCVGKVVAAAAHEWMEHQRTDESRRFRIGGLYPIDRAARKQGSRDFQKYFDRSLREFRKGYLREMDWLVILGGNEGTLEEHDAAEGIEGPRVAAIPSLGGAAKKLRREKARTCERPIGDARVWDTTKVNKAVRYLLEGTQ